MGTSEKRREEGTTPGGVLSVRELRRRWKPIKEGAAAADEHEPIRVRLHRCWSWLKHLEDIEAAGLGTGDLRIVYGWIGFNSLYAQWDAERREPIPDGRSLGDFQTRLLNADRDRRFRSMLEGNREIVAGIVGDEFLSRYFWQDPGENEVRRAQDKALKLGQLYEQGCYADILDMAIRRVYVARCQLIHGGATHGSKLNREGVTRCADFLSLYLTAAALVIIDHAWDQDWSGICYPPMG